MSNKFENPLIGIGSTDTFEKVNGMLDLLKAVDYSGQGTGCALSEDAEIALMNCMRLMQDALRHEAERERKNHAAAAGFKAAG